MADQARTQTDQILRQLEKKILKTYKESQSSIQEKWNDYMKSIKPKLDALQTAYDEAKKSGDKDLIKTTGKKLGIAQREVTIKNQYYKNMINQTVSQIANVNQTALDIINDKIPSVYTINYNQMADSTDIVKGYSFNLADENTVKALAKNDTTLLPTKKLNVTKDKAWNKKILNSQVMQGILQGESIDDISKRLQNVTDMNRSSAIRNARTMTTSAECKGRQDSYVQAEKDGIIMKRVWIATSDERTRAWHSDLNGVAVEVDEPWTNDYGEIMYPGDSSAHPANVYNCRCSIKAKVTGFKKNNGVINYSQSSEKLTRSEEGELMSYKSFDYYAINESLRTKGLKSLSSTQKKKVNTLDSALSKLPTYSGDVSRSLYFSNDEELNNFIADVKDKSKLVFSAYTSTTSNKDKLYNPKGQVQMFISNTTTGRSLAGYDNGEDEVLFMRNSKFKIQNQYWKDNKYIILLTEL